jgi:hypothetical protein
MHSESQWRQGVDCRGWVAPGWLQVQSRRGLKYGAARRPAMIAPDQCDSLRSIRMLSELELHAVAAAAGIALAVTVDPRDPPGGVPAGPASAQGRGPCQVLVDRDCHAQASLPLYARVRP